MVTEHSFLIDATFLLDDAQKTFFGSAPLIDESGRNTSVLYGAVRDLLRLRVTLGINRGIVVFGEETDEVSSELNVGLFREFLLRIGTNVLHDTTVCVGTLCRSIVPDRTATWIVTRNKSLMQLINVRCNIILVSEGSVPEVTTEKVLESRYRLRPEQVPSFLALTESRSSETPSTKQAVRLLEMYGTLSAALESSGTDEISPKMRRYLSTNKAMLLSRLQELTIIDYIEAKKRTVRMDPIVENNEESRCLFKAYGFPSLGRHLDSPQKVELFPTVQASNHSYVAIVDQVGLCELEEKVAKAKICAVDTESTDKDPRKATLLGVALAINEGQAFYIPLTATDLRDITVDSVLDVLRRLLGGQIKVIGHNLKYDYVLLKRNGIHIQVPHFDTMLAAHECFGDWDFFNLGAVAKKLIGMEVKRYRDIVDKGQTLQDIPFKDLVEHGCVDADATLRLYSCLRTTLKEKFINTQFTNEVMPLMQLLGDKELDGVQMDIGAIIDTKDRLTSQAESVIISIFAQAGKQFDIDSMKEIDTVFRSIEGLRDRIGRLPLRYIHLEQLAQGNAFARTIVQFRRLQKQVKQLEAICKGEKNGKVFPLFSQIKAAHGSISSIDPNLFLPDGCLRPEAVLDKDIRQRIPDENRALDILQQITGDRDLEKDRLEGKNEFIVGDQPPFVGLNHANILISLSIGSSNAALCKKFLIDARKANNLREWVTGRYPRLFAELEEHSRKIISTGFASSEGRRRYLNGLNSSDIDKRNRALRSAVRWLIGM